MSRGRPRTGLERWGVINTRQLPDGRHQAEARYRDSTGTVRRIRRIESSAARARRSLEDALHEKAATDTRGLIGRDSTMNALLDRWERELYQSTRAVATQRVYREIITHTLRPALGSLRLHEVTPGRVDRLLTDLHAARGYSRAESARKVVKQVLDSAVKLDAIPTNPAMHARLPRPQTAPVSAPTLDDVRRLREHVAAWEGRPSRNGRPRRRMLADFIDLLAATGCRPGEALALRWVDVDLEAGAVSITGTLIVDLEGRSKRQDHTKSRAGMRRLVLPRYAVDVLTRRRVESTTDLVFPSAAGTPMSQGNLRIRWREAVAGSEFEGLTPRSVRKAVATELARALDPKAAQAQLGHATAAVTERHYIEAAPMPDVSALLERE